MQDWQIVAHDQSLLCLYQHKVVCVNVSISIKLLVKSSQPAGPKKGRGDRDFAAAVVCGTVSEKDLDSDVIWRQPLALQRTLIKNQMTVFISDLERPRLVIGDRRDRCPGRCAPSLSKSHPAAAGVRVRHNIYFLRFMF